MRAKARFSGGKISKPSVFPEGTKKNLFDLINKILISKEESERCVSELLDAADPFLGICEVIDQHMHKKEDLVKEQTSFQSRLELLARDLRRISPCILEDYRGLHPLILEMESMAERFKCAGVRLEKTPRKPKRQDMIRAHAEELTRQILRILHKYRIPVSATCNRIGSTRAYESNAVEILNFIFAAVDFPQAPDTTRDYIARAKSEHNNMLLNTVKQNVPGIPDQDIKDLLSGFTW